MSLPHLLNLPAPKTRHKILVIGATGYVGSRLVPELVAQGHDVAIYVRNPKRVMDSWEGFVTVHVGEIDEEEKLSQAMQGVDAVYWLIHSLGASGDWESEDDRLAAIANKIARQEKVPKIIYLSGLGQETGQSAHLNSRHKTGKILASDDQEVVEIRAAIIIGSGSLSWTLLRDLSNRLPVMITPRWVSSKCEAIAVRDVLFYLLAALDKTPGIYEIGSGEVMTYGELIKLAARAQKRPIPKMIPVPLLTPRISSWWLHLITRVDQKQARPLIEGLRENTIVSPSRAWRELEHPLPLEEAMQRALGTEQKNETVSFFNERSARKYPDAKSILKVDMMRTSEKTTPEEAWKRLRLDFGNNYGKTQWLWEIRGALDRLIGGPGMRIRRPKRGLRVGDQFDFWRVEDVKANEYLYLVAEMKAPGVARMHLSLSPGPEEVGTTIVIRSSLEDANIWGRLYWYLLLPIHNIIFRQIIKGIVP